MQCCVALINPSTFEGWSTAVEEAKAIGTPMILSSLRVHKEQSDRVAFFDPKSPEELANLLGISNLNNAVNYFSIKSASSQLSFGGNSIFSNKFADLMELASQRQ